MEQLEILRVNTSNVRRLSVADPSKLDALYIDGQHISCNEGSCGSLFRDDKTGIWKVDIHTLEKSEEASIVKERQGRQLGPLAAILETPGTFTIVIGTQGTAEVFDFQRVAFNIAQNLFVYFGADVDIRFDYELEALELKGNVISFGMRDQNAYLDKVFGRFLDHPFPIGINNHTISVDDGRLSQTYGGKGIGAIFLCPLVNDRLMVSISGTDPQGLEKAAKLFPYRTGVGQPDWIVVGPEMGVHGMPGVRAMGYYSNSWAIETDVSIMT